MEWNHSGFRKLVSTREAQIMRDNNITVNLPKNKEDHPVAMHSAMIREIEEAVQSVGVDYMTMPSGAGHDAMHWADDVPTGMIFIPCREGISHNPAEFADMDDIVTGAKILDTVLRKLSLESTKLN